MFRQHWKALVQYLTLFPLHGSSDAQSRLFVKKTMEEENLKFYQCFVKKTSHFYQCLLSAYHHCSADAVQGWQGFILSCFPFFHILP